MNNKLTPNELAFIALSNEYCQCIETVHQTGDRDTIVESMLKVLPRIYITATDLSLNGFDDDIDEFIDAALDENTYDMVRVMLSQLMAEDDVYLETFMEDMRYSDSPISATVSENLADLYQEFYNFVHGIQDVTTAVQRALIEACLVNFREYWGQTLCNVLRAMHSIRYTI